MTDEPMDSLRDYQPAYEQLEADSPSESWLRRKRRGWRDRNTPSSKRKTNPKGDKQRDKH